MIVTLNTLDVENAKVEKLQLKFEYDMSVQKNKHVVSLTIGGTKYYVYVNDLTPAINAVIEHQDANRNETYNDPLPVDIPELEEEIEEFFEE